MCGSRGRIHFCRSTRNNTNSQQSKIIGVMVVSPDADGPTNNDTADTQLMVEERYHEALETLVYSKLDQILESEDDDDDTTWFDLGEAEHQILLNMNNMGLWEGSVAGVVTLICLRQGRRVLFGPRRVTSTATGLAAATSNHRASSGFRSSTTIQINAPPLSSPITSRPLSHHHHRSPFRQQMDQWAHSRAGTVLGWLIDLAVSLTVGASVSAAYTDEEKMLQELADIPLVAGPSQISRQFCPVVQDALAQLNREATTPAEQAALTRPRTPYMAAWIAFSHSCHLRQAQEQLIRRQHGLNPDAIVNIPPPGVSKLGSDGHSWDDINGLRGDGAEGYDDDDDYDDDYDDDDDDFSDTMMESSESADDKQAKDDYSRRR
jgi:hypothetical protein